jgi:cytochrome c-type biogenesis protein CcmE
MKKKTKIIMAGVVIAISVSILLWSLSPPESETVGKIVDNPGDFIGKSIQIKGIVENNSLENGTNEVTFRLSDEKERDKNVTILYEGTPPNNFEEGKTVFIKGTLERDDDDELIFMADKIIVGCPSKYD